MNHVTWMEKESKCRRNVNRMMLQAHAVGVVESESRMQQELKAESERMKDFKEHIAENLSLKEQLAA